MHKILHIFFFGRLNYDYKVNTLLKLLSVVMVLQSLAPTTAGGNFRALSVGWRLFPGTLWPVSKMLLRS